ncbi:LRP chaperone MESD isoform X1 [Puma concolor]|uniref:LRP chaperone MESD n=1 Tax=Puma concolor TaxID=9696 RepID=A0A6P6HGE0_PUMCO|nr:LRP chaperone MESD isoform X1 [Puma concolor]
MAASGWVRAALVLLCASDLLLPPLPPRACAAEGVAGTPGEASPPPRKKKKDIRDYNDADMARLLEQWEKDDDIEEGDLPEHKRPSAPIDFSQIDPGRPESILKMTRKGKTLMMFVTVSGNPTEKETEEITSLWQGSLFNANYDVQRVQPRPPVLGASLTCKAFPGARDGPDVGPGVLKLRDLVGEDKYASCTKWQLLEDVHRPRGGVEGRFPAVDSPEQTKGGILAHTADLLSQVVPLPCPFANSRSQILAGTGRCTWPVH